MTTLEEKVMAIIESSDFNDLPFEERKKICKYLSRMQILTLWQVLNKYNDLVTPAWKKKMRSWLKSCVEDHQNEYGVSD